MRKLKIFIIALAAAAMAVPANATELTDKLAALDKVSNVTALADSAGFAEKYSMTFTHPVDYGNPAVGTFTQRVVVQHVGFDRPTVVVTEGYWGDYAFSPFYRDELSRLFNTNVVFCEYRYFGPSTPTPCNWKYMTVENSLDDLHEVVQAMKTIYKGKWMATGISKGGTTTMCYRAYFPDDVDISVPYVAPLTRNLEDGRHEPFIAKITGTPEGRQHVHDVQMEFCRRKAEILPYFKQLCEKKGYHFYAPIDEIYDYWVLEYSFAYWQWGMSPKDEPAADASAEEVAKWMFKVNDPEYFAIETPYVPFNYQAAHEIGYYGYDTKPFKPYMKGLKTKDYLRRLMLPDSLRSVKFDKTLYKTVKKYLKKNDPKMIYIYGQYDPWTASGVYPWLDTSKKKNLQIYVQPGGNHGSRIGNMPELMKEQIISQIRQWLDE